ncbi:MAG: NAD(P)H-hydrate dehydratase [Ignavibacteriales bacterium]|nr:NAD(P)H-hydrate dehydratase [Ignavibacteriales bacterium]
MWCWVCTHRSWWCDDVTIHKHGVPSLLLMENAGRGVAETAVLEFGPPEGKRILLFCGKGNNGGDGFVAARHLLNAGANVTVVLLSSASTLQGDARSNYDTLTRLKQPEARQLSIKKFSRTLLKTLHKQDLVIDAIFGTGFSGEVRDPFLTAIHWINRQRVPVLSVDIPSGVDGTTGVVVNAAVKARCTVTFGLAKSGLLCNQGQDHVGTLRTIDIGIPRNVSCSKSLKTFLVEQEDVHRVLPQRPSTANKYSVGKVFVLAGARGYTGAAYLCAMAALRAGAGAVMLGIPEAVYTVVARNLAEAIVKPLPSTKEGTIARDALGEINEKLSWADVAVLGPGLSTNPETQEVIAAILRNHPGKMVLDADALRGVADIGLEQLGKLKGRYILTPHAGEYSRIIGVPAKEIEAKRIEMARTGSSKGKATIVLKGGPTATGIADGTVYLNSTGNPGMATVGSGDVLAGIIAALWAQGMPQSAAAYSGVFLHGLAGDIARDILGGRSIIAGDLIGHLPAAIRKVENI